MRQNTLRRSRVAAPRARSRRSARCAFALTLPLRARAAARSAAYERFPYVPADPRTRDERCAEVYNIQVQGAGQAPARHGHREARDRRLGRPRLDAGAAGLRAGDGPAGLPRANILGYTMPGFATSDAHAGAGAAADASRSAAPRSEIDIRPSCLQMLKDIGHPFAEGPAGLRHHLRERAGRRAHQPSVPARQLPQRASWSAPATCRELALGWCTYGVGDHMSHYNVNASVPKTLIQHLVRWVAETDAARRRTCSDVLHRRARHRDQPGAGAGRARDGSRAETEASSGRTSCRTSTSTTPCASATRRPRSRSSPGTRVAAAEYQRSREIRKWLGDLPAALLPDQPVQAQRVPNAPKVGSGGSLSPRGDWRAPSRRQAPRLAQGPRARPHRGISPEVFKTSPLRAAQRGLNFACASTSGNAAALG